MKSRWLLLFMMLVNYSVMPSAGIRLAVNHQMRFMDQYRIILDALKSGRYGELCSMTVVGGCFGGHNGSHYIEAFVG